MSMRVCCFRVTVPAVQYDPRISSQAREIAFHARRSLDCLTLSARSRAVSFQPSFLELQVFAATRPTHANYSGWDT